MPSTSVTSYATATPAETCAENHRTAECNAYRTLRCANCRNGDHASWSRTCPEFGRKRQALDAKYPELPHTTHYSQPSPPSYEAKRHPQLPHMHKHGRDHSPLPSCLSSIRPRVLHHATKARTQGILPPIPAHRPLCNETFPSIREQHWSAEEHIR